jgi:hypothetical protein
MPVTTREYSLTQATPAQIIRNIEHALEDLGLMDPVAMGYLLTFTNTAGGVVPTAINKRYLVAPSASSGPGTKAVFDVLRSITGAISAVTLVTGGSGYRCFAIGGITEATAVIDGLTDTSNLSAGMVVTKVSGTGTLAVNTVIASVDDPTQITLSAAPTVGLNAAVLLFADTLTLSAASIGGATYVKGGTTGTSGQTTVTVTANANITPGQLVTGTNICPRALVVSVTGLVVTLSAANIGAVNGNVTFSDEINVAIATIANVTDLAGTAAGYTITGVLTNAGIRVGCPVVVLTGTPTLPGGSTIDDGQPYISTITGTGPYTITLTNKFGTFSGFSEGGAITFSAFKGSASQFFEKDTRTTPLTAAWGVAKITNNAAKVLGTTFWVFYCTTSVATHLPTGGVTPYLYVRACPGFNPAANTVQGVAVLDYFNTSAVASAVPFSVLLPIASNTNAPIVLRTRQSGVDPNFATISFIEGSNAIRSVFFLSKYDTLYQPWDLDDVFLGCAFELFINIAFNTSDSGINIRTRMTGLPKRMAEAGYGNYYQTLPATQAFTNIFFRSSSGNRQLAAPVAAYDDVSLYSRAEGDIQNGVATVAVYKNVPICLHFAPVPYYLPADIVIAEVPFANVNNGDTLTVSAGEIYTVVQTAVNAASSTSLVLAVRTT